MFFSTSNKLKYDNFIVANMTVRVNIAQYLLKNNGFFYTYELKEGETPETLAYNNYGNTEYHWIVLLVNEIYDPFYGWYMTYKEILEYSKKKYGDPAYQEVKHWVKDDVIYQEDPGQGVAVTNLEWEITENDKKQTVKLVYPEYTAQFVAEFEKLAKQ